ncbi:ribosome biogenesis GTP-binding protein YsxC [Aphanomyces invadans]|uniref:Ribosome biogenesis GTP-binding protein YsxC n=1 Tax=Aphanomyces invadans TaxID=157072 RepID=A0A024UT92_9STRA|nr:ribosome biogenesis GTP-binding protein YsxC [Aphanomyces invadans]ETW09175.1 ribosome biogenesis GTP-binding protein YsxC [Aphanomyces invadans]|eukprot:XP_008862980.1 ribosome biogenesis GTP-binding protein YsxC [Aphanomyces invadans]
MAKRGASKSFQALRSLIKDVDVPPPLKPHEESYVKKIFASTVSQRMQSLSRSEKADLPAWDGPEIAFAGRSNVGKSTLINALTSSTIMKTSKTPGRTQQLHFISVGGRAGTQPDIALVDMPGFGFANAPKSMVDDFHRLVGRYIKHRTNANLKRVFLLIDSRRGITPVDTEFMEFMENLGTTFQLVFTKVDTLSSSGIEKTVASAENCIQNFMMMHPIMHLVSSKNNIGIRELRNEVVSSSGLLFGLHTKAQRRAIREQEAGFLDNSTVNSTKA